MGQKMNKPIQTIIAATVEKSARLFEKGVIIQAPGRQDVMVAMLIDATTGKLASRSEEVVRYVAQYEDVCKYAKEVEPEVKEIYRKMF